MLPLSLLMKAANMLSLFLQLKMKIDSPHQRKKNFYQHVPIVLRSMNHFLSSVWNAQICECFNIVELYSTLYSLCVTHLLLTR
jgi:DNA topoisomerase VI subunit B